MTQYINHHPKSPSQPRKMRGVMKHVQFSHRDRTNDLNYCVPFRIETSPKVQSGVFDFWLEANLKPCTHIMHNCVG